MTARDDIRELLVHAVTIETADGTDSHGRPHYKDPTTIAAFLDGPALTAGGDAWAGHTIGGGTLFADLADGPLLTVGSRVTGPHGEALTVQSLTWHDGGALDLPDHAEAVLT